MLILSPYLPAGRSFCLTVFLSSCLIISFLIHNSSFVIRNSYALESHTYFYHTDQVGSVVAVTDENGNLVEQNKFNPYGQSSYQIQNTKYQIPEQYTGQIKDQNTSLQYYNARYYDPNLSRFISADSVNDQLNRYNYVGGNPVSRNDPVGNFKCGYLAGKYYPCPDQWEQMDQKEKDNYLAQRQQEQQTHESCNSNLGCRIKNVLGYAANAIPIPFVNSLISST